MIVCKETKNIAIERNLEAINIIMSRDMSEKIGDILREIISPNY